MKLVTPSDRFMTMLGVKMVTPSDRFMTMLG